MVVTQISKALHGASPATMTKPPHFHSKQKKVALKSKTGCDQVFHKSHKKAT